MKLEPGKLLVRSSPFVRAKTDTPRVMLDVLIALVPIIAMSIWLFGISALLVLVATTLGAILTERVFGTKETISDKSAILTGILLGLTLPPGFPLWMAFVGGVAGIGLGKAVWGGLGNNLFNPALVGRAFLQAAFPTAITTWTQIRPVTNQGFATIEPATIAMPLVHVDAVSTASPLGLMKFKNEGSDILDLFLGSTPGSLGETSALLILLALAWLVFRRALDWRIPTSILLSVAIFSSIAWLLGNYPSPWFMLSAGGLLFGTVFMATDPVTSPMAPKAVWIYGVGIGILVVLIRLWGGLPEGVMYAILLMNAVTPLLNRVIRVRPFGRA